MNSVRPQPEEIESMIQPILQKARIPGGAVAIVQGTDTVLAMGFGYRDRSANLPVTAQTIYPIASTTKAINATLIGMLIDDGLLKWDEPVQQYLPGFRLTDPVISAQVTLRDLLVMRTGLPRHDWLWIDNPITRADLTHRLRHLDLAAGFRETFLYNNVTVTVAGHVAEVASGKSWETLVSERILEPLGMRATSFRPPSMGNITLAYHENSSRELLVSERFATAVTAPSGGAIHSTVEDMARWIGFNLIGGEIKDKALIKRDTLAEIHAPQMVARTDPSAPTPLATYAMGWFIHSYGGRRCLSHGGFLHDINSEVMLLPEDGIGIVSFTNFGFPSLARLVNQYVLDAICGLKPQQTVEEKLADYEKRIGENRSRLSSLRRVKNTSPSHALDAYTGTYQHLAYGTLEIECGSSGLSLRRNSLVLPLEHWHYDAWIAEDVGRFFIHIPHAFDQGEQIAFETGPNGEIGAVSIHLEPLAPAIRFAKRQVLQK